MSFADSLKTGAIGEGIIARYFQRCGYNILPAYEVEKDTGKGPRLYTPKKGMLITPDLLVFNGQKTLWAEAKTKAAFTWYRQDGGSWQTGIDRRHWNDYQRVAAETPFPVFLFFLHRSGGEAKDTPSGSVSPSGLYWQNITVLQRCIDHISDKHGPSGMVYWREDSLVKVAEYEEILRRVA